MASRLTVIAQFLLIGVLLWPTTRPEWSPIGAILIVLAIAITIWTLRHNRLGNFNIRPEPKANGRLIMSGPYAYVRHPMYVALLIFAAAICFFYAAIFKLAASLVLALVLWIKTTLEERALCTRFPEYSDYARRVRRFIPGVL